MLNLINQRNINLILQYTLNRLEKMKTSDITKYKIGCGATGTLILCWYQCPLAPSI